MYDLKLRNLKKADFKQGQRVELGRAGSFIPKELNKIVFADEDAAANYLHDELENEVCRFVNYREDGVDMIAVGIFIHDSDLDEYDDEIHSDEEF